ncbi:hypothetical protein BGZ96_008199, partial [Linnemannia gamsii]
MSSKRFGHPPALAAHAGEHHPSAVAGKVLQRLKHNGDKAKQNLYSDCLTLGPSKHPLKISQSQFATLTLLDLVQNKPDVEEDLRKLRQRRLKERGDVVFIPPRAKVNLKASDDILFDLTKKVEEFLASNDQKVLLLLGDSGSGKSTFNRQIEHDLWQKYEKTKGRIPLFINLSAKERPDQDMVVKQLRKFELSDSQIRELKPTAKAVIAPFSRPQVDDYVAKYVTAKTPLWTTKQYTDVLDQIPSLQELVKNPFLLTLSLEVLPRIVDPSNNLKATRVNRVTLLTDEGFTQNGISFLKDMAKAIYKNQADNPVVTYSRKRDQGKWKEAFFSRENESQLLLEASPLTRSGIQYRFIHKSLLEYFFARSVFEPQYGKEKSFQAVAPTRRGSVSSSFSFDDQL